MNDKFTFSILNYYPEESPIGRYVIRLKPENVSSLTFGVFNRIWNTAQRAGLVR